MRARAVHLATIALGLCIGTSVASAAPFSSITTFGDSLTDTGNVFLASGGTVPTAPYFNGRFTNGPVWLDYFAATLGVPAGAVPALAGGSNFAFGGARTDASGSPVPGLLAQIGGFWAPMNPGGADPDGLYVLIGGGNDMRDARSTYQGDTAGDQAGRQNAAQAAIGNLINGLGFLAAQGAKHAMVASMPDLGATPEAAALGLVDASSDASARFNALMPLLLGAGAGFGLNMHFLDMAGLAADIRNDALLNGGAQYGITNVFTPCGPFQGSIGISCDVSLFSDALHPSARAHQLLGQRAASLFAQRVPEPESAVLLLLGFSLATLGFARRRRT